MSPKWSGAWVARLGVKGALLPVFCVTGCGNSAQELTELDLQARGTSDAVVELDADVSITVTRADLAFGPLYLCPGAQAGALCDTARLEWLDAAVVDALRDEPAAVGTLAGATGTVRSWMFDYGITSLLTREEPLVLPAAESLGDASVVLEGEADVAGVIVPFEAKVVVRQAPGTERGLPVLRKSSSELFEHDVTRGDEALVVRFDPKSWISDLRRTDFVQMEECRIGGPEVVCMGQVEAHCDETGSALATVDCETAGQVCAPDVGCADRVTWPADSRAQRSIRLGLTAGVRPVLTFE